MSIFDFTPPEWMAEAPCASVDPELFFPDKGATRTVAEARAICADCPVRAQCLEYALTSEEALYGVWAGTTERDRRPMRKARGISRYERSHCRNGHKYTDETTKIDAAGHRRCLTCSSESQKRHRIGSVA